MCDDGPVGLFGKAMPPTQFACAENQSAKKGAEQLLLFLPIVNSGALANSSQP